METKNRDKEKKKVASRVTRNATPGVSNQNNILASLGSRRITKGAFGQSLEEFARIHNVPGTTVKKVMRSPDFMKIARALDKKYVSTVASQKFNPWYDDRYRISGGNKGMPSSFIGKMELEFTRATGAHFSPSKDPDNIKGVDFICIGRIRGARFIQELVHESCHAYNHSHSTTTPPKDLVASVRADTQEEIKVRKREHKILKEINKGRKTKLNFSPVGSTIPALVARDFSPGLGLTYLENSFFAYQLRTLQVKEKISEEQAKKMREKVSKNKGLPFMPHPDPKSGLFELSEYGATWADRIKAKKSWAKFNRSSKKNSSSARETKIQRHAKLFFKGLRYSKLPGK